MPLSEICIINPKIGSEAPPSDTEVSFVPMAAVAERQGGIVQAETRLFRDVAKGYTFFRENDVLFAKITPCMENGKIAMARGLVNGIGFGSTEFHVIRCGPDVLPEWVFAFVSQPAFRAAARESFTGTAGQQRVPADFVKNAAIPLPPLPEQHRLVRLLDEADALSRLRARADARMSDFIPALFHDMFGDPAKNEKGWPIVKTEKLFSEDRPGVKCGPFGSALKKHEYVDSGVPVWGIDNVAPNQFVEPGPLFITKTKYSELKSYSVEAGDILISRAGTVGRMCVARPTQLPSIIGTNLIRLVFDQSKIAPEYFTSLFTHFPATASLRANADEGSYSFMNTKVLKSLQILLPPLSLQRQFAARVSEARALEEMQAQSKARLEALFESMLARTFAEEL